MLETEFRLWTEKGWIDPGVEGEVAVQALVALTEQTVHQWCAEPGDPDVDEVAAVVAHAWTSILRMVPGGSVR